MVHGTLLVAHGTLSAEIQKSLGNLDAIHFVRTNQLVENFMPIDQALADTNGKLDDQHGKEAIINSKSYLVSYGTLSESLR